RAALELRARLGLRGYCEPADELAQAAARWAAGATPAESRLLAHLLALEKQLLQAAIAGSALLVYPAAWPDELRAIHRNDDLRERRSLGALAALPADSPLLQVLQAHAAQLPWQGHGLVLGQPEFGLYGERPPLWCALDYALAESRRWRQDEDRVARSQ